MHSCVEKHVCVPTCICYIVLLLACMCVCMYAYTHKPTWATPEVVAEAALSEFSSKGEEEVVY